MFKSDNSAGVRPFASSAVPWRQTGEFPHWTSIDRSWPRHTCCRLWPCKGIYWSCYT